MDCTLNFARAIEWLDAKSRDDHAKDPAHRGEGVVILIDEYDAPVGHALDDLAKANAIRARMSAVYSQMKNRVGCIRFLFMTGVSKFTKLSVFSAPSNIRDMTWDASLGVKLLAADWPRFFIGLKSLYAHLPYGPTEESVQEFSYERVLYTLLATQGIEVVAEDRQSNGRSDIVAKHKRGIYIFELKVGGPVDKAFAQICAKGYADPYVASGKPIWLVGLSFDPESRKLVECAAVPHSLN